MSYDETLQEIELFMGNLPSRSARGGSPIFLGIDPGAAGAVSFLHPSNNSKSIAVDIPTLKAKIKKKGKVSYRTHADLAAIWGLFKSFKRAFGELHVTIEQQQPMPRDTALTAFSVGKNFAMWPLFFYSHGVSHDTIRPVAWKKQMGLIRKDKEAARLKAQQMFPGASLKRKKDHNRAESLLIAECGRIRSMTNGG